MIKKLNNEEILLVRNQQLIETAQLTGNTKDIDQRAFRFWIKFSLDDQWQDDVSHEEIQRCFETQPGPDFAYGNSASMIGAPSAREWNPENGSRTERIYQGIGILPAKFSCDKEQAAWAFCSTMRTATVLAECYGCQREMQVSARPYSTSTCLASDLDSLVGKNRGVEEVILFQPDGVMLPWHHISSGECIKGLVGQPDQFFSACYLLELEEQFRSLKEYVRVFCDL